MRAALGRRFRRRRNQKGFVTLLVAMLIPTVFMVCAAFAIDTANWYAQERDMQKAADAAALAGVPYLPNDISGATTKAQAVAALNGYTNGVKGVVVSVGLGSRPTQLSVTISSPVSNQFASTFGVPTTTLARTAVADYQGPQPMGSPCNTFGNEPTSGTGGSSATPSGTALGSKPFSNCSSTPQFWGVIEGPQTDKIQGDEFQTLNCASNDADNCASNQNSEYEDFGYTYVVKVQAAAVGTPVNLELYDPEFADTNGQWSSSTTSGLCGALPPASSWPTGSGNLNPYVTKADAKTRYASPQTTSDASNAFCNGDYFPGTTGTPLTTTFVLRQTNLSNNPEQAAVQNSTTGTPCEKQYGGLDPTWSTNLLTSGASGYNATLAQTFHNWVSFCTFTPSVAGDYYLQVRTNVSAGSTTAQMAAATGNTTSGYGANTFSMRAVTNSGLETSVAVAGYSHMPIDINATGSTSTFNLIRVAPGAAGQFISFSFFDAGDATGNGAIKILTPTDATGSITSTPFPGSCSAVGGAAGSGTTLSNCNAPISQATNNGKLETVTVPVPTDYSCNYASFGGCWYRVQITFSGASSVTDVTTWNATVVGDPVRLVQ